MTTIRDLPDELVTAIAFKAAGHRPQLRLVCRRFCALINEAVATSETWRVEYLLDRVQSDVIRERLRPCTSYHTDQPSVLELLSRANRIVNLNSEKNRAIVERLFNPTDVFDGVCEDFNNTSPVYYLTRQRCDMCIKKCCRYASKHCGKHSAINRGQSSTPWWASVLYNVYGLVTDDVTCFALTLGYNVQAWLDALLNTPNEHVTRYSRRWRSNVNKEYQLQKVERLYKRAIGLATRLTSSTTQFEPTDSTSVRAAKVALYIKERLGL